MKKISSLHFTLFLLGVCVFFLSSCMTPKKINYLQKPGNSIPKYVDTVGYEEYVLAPGDRLMLRVYSLDESVNTLFNGKGMTGAMVDGASDFTDLYVYTIENDGTISLPQLGDVTVGGLYLRDAKRKIEKEVQTLVIDQCAVDLKVTGRYFSIIGGGTNGKYPIFREKMNIFQALAMAGNISTYGDRSKINILRQKPTGAPEIKTFDVRSEDIINSEYFYIQPNDVIYIQDVKEQFFSVASFGNLLSTAFTTISFGVLIKNLFVSNSDSKETKPQNP